MEDSTHSTDAKHPAAKRSLLLVALAVGLGLVFDIFFFGKLPGISFPIYTILTIAALMAAARYEQRHVPRTALYMIPLLVFFSSMVFVRAGDLLTFINVVTTLFLLTLFVQLTLRPALRLYVFEDYSTRLLRLPLKVLGRAGELFKSAAPGRTFMAQHQAVPQVVRGILIAVPILLLFIALFSSADLVFRQYVGDVFSFKINGELFWRAVFAVLVAIAFTGLFGVVGRREDTAAVAQANSRPRKFGLVEMTILFGSLNALFLLFILIQLTYLFGGASNVIGGNFTYAEYARKGFFELIAVAGLTLLLIFVAERLLLIGRQMHEMRFKILSGLLIVQVLIIMISAFKRLHLYESAYGFTSARLFSYIFLTWLAAVFALLLYKIFADRREHVFAFSVFVSVMALLVFVNCFNIDAVVAHKNIARYEATGKLDGYYLSTLSDDATIELSRLLTTKDPDLHDMIATHLRERQQWLWQEDSAWQSTNLTRKAALRSLNEHAELLGPTKNVPLDPGYRGPGQQ